MPFIFERVADGVTAGGYYYAANNFAAAEHGGTHLDSPIHFAAGKNTTDQIPLEQLVGPAVVIDVMASTATDADYQIQVSDIEAWERKNGRIPDNSVLLLRTGWDTRWPDRKTYLGTSKVGSAAVAELHFPGLDPNAAQWIVANRRVDAVGIDTPSIDYGQSTKFETHQTLFCAEHSRIRERGESRAVACNGRHRHCASHEDPGRQWRPAAHCRRGAVEGVHAGVITSFLRCYPWIFRSSTSKSRVALGGMTPPAPLRLP